MSITLSHFKDSELAINVCLPCDIIKKIEERVEKHDFKESSKLFGLISAVAYSSYKRSSPEKTNKEILAAMDNTFEVYDDEEFRKMPIIFDTKEYFQKRGTDKVSGSMDSFYFEFIDKPNEYRKKIVDFDAKNPQDIANNLERLKRVFGLQTSLLLIEERAKSRKDLEKKLMDVYQEARYMIDCMTYFSSPKIDKGIFDYLKEYKMKNPGKFCFLDIGCACADEENNLLAMQDNEKFRLFDKIMATDISDNFLYAAKKRYPAEKIEMERLSIYDLNKEQYKKELSRLGISPKDKVITLISGVLSRVRNPFKQLSNVAEISDLAIVSEGFPFYSDNASSEKNRVENMNEFYKQFSKAVPKDSNYKITLQKKLKWDVSTLRCGNETYDNELIIIKNLNKK